MKEQDLAKMLGISRQYLCAIIKGKRDCSLKLLKRIAESLNVSVAMLFDSYVPPVMNQMYLGSWMVPNSNIKMHVFAEKINMTYE